MLVDPDATFSHLIGPNCTRAASLEEAHRVLAVGVPSCVVVASALLGQDPASRLAIAVSGRPGAAVVVVADADAPEPLRFLVAGAHEVVRHGTLSWAALDWAVQAAGQRADERHEMGRLETPGEIPDPAALGDRQQREAAEVRFGAAFLRSAFGMIISDAEAVPTAVNPALAALLGRNAEDLIGHGWKEYTHPDDHYLNVRMFAAIRAGQRSYSDERRYLRPDGSVVWVALNLNVICDDADRPLYIMAHMHDISDRKRMEKELQHRALHDDLTGLPNRALLSDRLEQALSGEKRSGHHTGVAFIDLDSFKHVNDVLGHAVGDLVLQEVASRLRHSVRPEDTVARFGGDEFVMVCENIDREIMGMLASRVTETLASPFKLNGHDIVLGASVGITTSRPGSTGPLLLSEADAAMYRAKELGRGRVTLFDDSLRARSVGLLEGERVLHQAIDRQELIAYYQPIVDLRTNAGVGVEALARWRAPDGRIVSPSQFIPLAERTGLILRLGQLILTQAVAEAGTWYTAEPGPGALWVSVNLSARQLADPNLADLVAGVLDRSDLPTRLLHVEVTETVVMEDIAQSVAVLERLKNLGVTIAIDDFGTGYSSLAYLQQLPIDMLKIDGSFVHRLRTGNEAVSIVKAIIGLSDALGMVCLAEGVETTEERTILTELGCQLGQGFLWSQPMTPPDAASWASRRSGSSTR